MESVGCSVVYELLKPSREIAIDYNWSALAKNKRLCSATCAQVIKMFLETLKWKVHLLLSPDIAPFNYHLSWSVADGLEELHFRSYEDTKFFWFWFKFFWFLNSLKRCVVYLTWNLNDAVYWYFLVSAHLTMVCFCVNLLVVFLIRLPLPLRSSEPTKFLLAKFILKICRAIK